MNYIEKHNSVYFFQYGFRKGHSTQNTILDIVNEIQANINQGLYSCGVFIDLKKAFDTVDHNILLDKLNFYGFLVNQPMVFLISQQPAPKLLKFLIKYQWNKATIYFGVLQGFVLGPLLFLQYVNDIHQCSTSLMIPIYFLLKKIEFLKQ